jgi:hypothetical protein
VFVGGNSSEYAAMIIGSIVSMALLWRFPLRVIKALILYEMLGCAKIFHMSIHSQAPDRHMREAPSSCSGILLLIEKFEPSLSVLILIGPLVS